MINDFNIIKANMYAHCTYILRKITIFSKIIINNFKNNNSNNNNKNKVLQLHSSITS